MRTVPDVDGSLANGPPSQVASRLALTAVLLLALVLRLSALEAGWFGVDQARDLAWASAIVEGSALPWTGPPMRNRVNLSALYYYFWAIPAVLSDRAWAFYAFAGLLGSAAILCVYQTASSLGAPGAGLIAALLLATSPQAVLDSRIAWAPAALVPAAAVFLVLANRFVRGPTTGRGAALAVTGSLATQLHLAAFPLCVVATGVLLQRRRSLGWRGLLVASVVGALPFVPMITGLAPRMTLLVTGIVESVRETTAHTAGSAASSNGHTSTPGSRIGDGPGPDIPRRFALRLIEIATLRGRAVEGLSPAQNERPVWATLVIRTQSLLIPLEALAIVALWTYRPREETRHLRVLLTATFFTSLSAVALLPAEGWYYYANPAQVPGTIALGALLARARPRLVVVALVTVLLVGQALFLVWWIGTSSRSGMVSASFDHLRLSGEPPPRPEARFRFLNLDIKQRAADVLTRELQIPRHRIWQSVHGPAFADLDSDNWFFFPAWPETEGRTGGRSALISRPGEWPDAWTAAFPRQVEVGPLRIFAYEPRLEMGRAIVEGCSERTELPEVARDPVDYGNGEMALPSWGCPAPVVRVPVVDDGPIEVRVFARMRGAGRVIRIVAEPPGETITAPSGDAGLLLARGTRSVRALLALHGPALLDIYELHGQDSATAARTRPEARDRDVVQ